MDTIETVLPHPDGAEVFLDAFSDGLKPDPPLWIDEWSEENMVIPADTGARLPGPYRLTTTPFARDVLRDLSPESPVRRVVAKVASQLWKTQVGINFIAACIARAPANILALEPTQTLTERLSSRIDKTIDAVDELRERVASPRSRDAKNTIGVKEFRGGSLHINTAGSESNLAELTARYVYGDEVNRWKRNLGQEGSPWKLAEGRQTQFGRSAKSYYSSSPTEKDASVIDELYEMGDQRHCYVPCPHCGHMQVLEMERVSVNDARTEAYYRCADEECACLIEEHHKPRMFAAYEWRAHAEGDGETHSYTQNALYAPLGSISWLDLWKEKTAAEIALAAGDDTLMRVFKNTREAVVFDSRRQVTTAENLQKRAEPYALRSMPEGVLAITASVDTQDDRLELKYIGWGEGLESWILDYQVIVGDPALPSTWNMLDEELKRPWHHTCGKEMPLRAALIDSGGHYTNEVYQFTRVRRYRHILAIAGARKPGRPVLAQKPSKVDVTWQGVTEPGGAELWMVGTDTAKDWIVNRFNLTSGPGAIHFSQDLPIEYYQQLTTERKVVRYVKGHKRIDWVKPNGARNEAFDLFVYNLAAAHYAGLHRWTLAEWGRLRAYYAQPSLFEPPAPKPAAADQQANPAPQQPEERPVQKQSPSSPAANTPVAAPARPTRRVSRSTYLRK